MIGLFIAKLWPKLAAWPWIFNQYIMEILVSFDRVNQGLSNDTFHTLGCYGQKMKKIPENRKSIDVFPFLGPLFPLLCPRIGA